MLTNLEFCNFHHPLPWKQSKMATKQKKLFTVRVKGIVCLPNRIAEIDTDTHYVYFVRRILSYVAFCIFNDFFNVAFLSFFLHFLNFSLSRLLLIFNRGLLSFEQS